MNTDEEKKKCESHSNTEFVGYTVEVKVPKLYRHRAYLISDALYGRVLVTEEWKKVHFKISPEEGDANKVPSGSGFYREMNVLPYKSAMTLAWHLIANSPEEIDVRLMPYRCVIATRLIKEEDRSIPVGEAR